MRKRLTKQIQLERKAIVEGMSLLTRLETDELKANMQRSIRHHEIYLATLLQEYAYLTRR